MLSILEGDPIGGAEVMEAGAWLKHYILNLKHEAEKVNWKWNKDINSEILSQPSARFHLLHNHQQQRETNCSSGQIYTGTSHSNYHEA